LATATPWRPLSPNAAEQHVCRQAARCPGADRAQDGERVRVAAGYRRLAPNQVKIVRMFEFMPLNSAPSRIRTCAHGSGVRSSDLANLHALPAWTRSLSSPAAEVIPRIFRIMETSAVTARTLQGMAPRPVRAGSGLALGF
jgi:hypothetical protein